jgi:rhodanese-related sulfurtransferase
MLLQLLPWINMLTQLIEFSIKHVGLVSVASTILCALGVTEYLQWVLASRALSPTSATLLINRKQAQIVDLREASEFLKGHLPEALHMAQVSSEGLLARLKPTQPIIFVTSQSVPSFSLLKQLRDAGFSELYHLEGGITTWEQAHLPMVRSLSET